MKTYRPCRSLAVAVALGLLASTAGAAPTDPAQCALMAPDAPVTRNDIAAASRDADSRLLLRFIHLTDDHVIDDDGQAVIGASLIDPLNPTFESAMRLQEEYSDEVLNDLEGRINACHAQYPAEFSIVTGDSADLTTVAETRRFIDNLDGTYDRLSAFEQKCRAALPAGSSEAIAQQQCQRFTGRGVADTQSVDPQPGMLLFQPLLTRTLLQLQATETAAATGRAADGSIDLTRQTLTRAPGLPQVLRCHAGQRGCANTRLDVPYYMVFGNHDGYVRGTLAIDTPANVVAETAGRHFMLSQREFIDEFFKTRPTPGPVGHGFHKVEAARRLDADDRNDGYYAFDAGNGRLRMIVLNTIVDGRDPRLPSPLRNPAGLADGSLDRVQFDWLKRQLNRAYNNRQLAMVFSHHPDLTFAEYGSFAALLNIEVTAVELNGLLASYPNLIAWVAGHTHRHRVRPFKVTGASGSNGVVSSPVRCIRGTCSGFWQIETASLIDFPQEQRLIEVYDNGDGTGTLRGPILGHGYEKSRALAVADDRCALYLADPASLTMLLSEADLGTLCAQGGTRQGEASDRHVELGFRIPPGFGAP